MARPQYFTIEQLDDTIVFSAIGEIGTLVEDAARDEWDALLVQLEQSDTKHAIIDLGSLDYFGSIMLELLVVLWKRVSSKEGKLALCNVSQVGTEILLTARFDTLWPILASRDEALEAVRS
jgi:anti-anti-sigma factor